MARLEDLQIDMSMKGILPDSLVTVVSVKWYGDAALELTYKTPSGQVSNEILYRSDEERLEIAAEGAPWSFDGDGSLFRLVSEAHRIKLAHLFDPVLAVHTSQVEPLPHQITAVYGSMLPRQPLRFLLADDPGAGKTIMAGLLIKELIARADLQRCLIVCPGSLAEQWQSELDSRFNLPFEILTNDKLETARTGNWFLENNLAIARLDKLSRDESVQDKLLSPDCRYDLIVCDEAHKMSATFFGNEAKFTKRYRLGQLLSGITRHFLLMTATPHNGKEADFQLFMALLDPDRFEGRFRSGIEHSDVSDLMRRMVKEELLKFDAKPLFPDRVAHTVPYKLSPEENTLYKEVTEYVREEFNRMDALRENGRMGTVGFALTILQRRLASSPAAIYHSLTRRKEKLEATLRFYEELRQSGSIMPQQSREFDAEDWEDFDEAPDDEIKQIEEQFIDQATASRSIDELRKEITTLKRLESLAASVYHSGKDKKWQELSELLQAIFFPRPSDAPGGEQPVFLSSPHQKLVIFTEHRDTLNYLEKQIGTLLGRPESVVCIHGGVKREDRLRVQEAFRHNPDVQVLIATDAAGEGINLQRAHLMINYDLPWNPNRLEQRFGRIHRIGQREICHLWNLVAHETREGAVYERLLNKLEEARKALGGRVFDVLGKMSFDGKPLRELLIEAIVDGERPEVRAKLDQVVENATNPQIIQDLFEEHALVRDTMDASKVFKVREEMERAEARRLQPHYIESFFLEAFRNLGGKYKLMEPRRYQVRHVPSIIRQRDRFSYLGSPVLDKYERIAFDKEHLQPQGLTEAAFVCPGHPLLDITISLTMERNRDLLRRGAVLVDERDMGTTPRVLFYLEHAIQDAGKGTDGKRRVVSKRLLYVEQDGEGNVRHLDYAPYLDYRPLGQNEPNAASLMARPECGFITAEMEKRAEGYAIANVVPKHLDEVRQSKISLLDKTEVEVRKRLTKEINFWDARARELKEQERAGKPNARLNSDEAGKRADMLQGRMQRRLEELSLERQLSPLPPVVLGGVLVVPLGLLVKMGVPLNLPKQCVDTQAAAAKAREIIMDIERGLGFEPVDREFDKLGYDIESRVPGTGKLRFLEVKGRVAGADTITVTKNEILYSLNKPEDFILAIVQFMPDGTHSVHYCREPFRREPDFKVTSVNYNFAELLADSEEPS